MEITKKELVELFIESTSFAIVFDTSKCIEVSAQTREDYNDLVEAKDRLLDRISALLERYNNEVAGNNQGEDIKPKFKMCDHGGCENIARKNKPFCHTHSLVNDQGEDDNG